MQYQIRTACPADEAKIRALFLEMLRTIYGKEEVEGYRAGYLDRYWTGSEERIYVAEDQAVVAFLSVEIHREERDFIYLDDLSVTAAYRNQGIGSALIRQAEAYGKEIQISPVIFHVEKTNRAALRLYQRLGYAIWRDEERRYLMKKDILP